MRMLACAGCGKSNPVLECELNTHVTCPNCGHQQKAEADLPDVGVVPPNADPPSLGMALLVGYALAALGIIGMILGGIALVTASPRTNGLAAVVAGAVFFALGEILLLARQIARQTWRGARTL
jgi:hypothetical protein